jgi:energy-coupling factor transporter ATP-binding protein EcfA2
MAHESFVPRDEFYRLMDYLSEPASRGVLLVGAPGTGKTSLLRMAEAELKRQDQTVFFVSLADRVDPRELGTRILDEVTASGFDIGPALARTLRSSARRQSLKETTAILRELGKQMHEPVLLLDALDETVRTSRLSAEVEELSLTLKGWKLVVASRPSPELSISRFARLNVIQLGYFTQAEAADMIDRELPELAPDVIARLTELADGNPLMLRALITLAQQHALPEGGPVSLSAMFQWMVDRASADHARPEVLTEILEEIALAGGREQIYTLAARSGMEEREVLRELDVLQTNGLVVVDHAARTARLFHQSFVDGILSQYFRDRPFSLADLQFGAEEAERDDLLTATFVRRHEIGRILGQRRSLVVGDRGAGKSAIFRTLATATPADEGRASVSICPVANTGDLLHRIVAPDAWTNADALRAAWLVVVAAFVAYELPPSAPKELRRSGANLRTALNLPTEPEGRLRRALRACLRPFGGTTLKFTVGPVGLEAQLPAGTSRPGGASVDVEAFLKEADSLLRQSAQRVVVMFDRIDETFKYDRAKQQAVVQALLQAESRVSQFECVGLLVLLRTDLFELYDIQEKNKLVSRTLTLEWSDEDWLQVLVRRVLTNAPLQRLATRLSGADGSADTRNALAVVFPPAIEGQPVDQWLLESLRNGNGDVSPRHAVLLLHLTRDLAEDAEAHVSGFPLFSAESVSRAMTKLSDLSFSEIVNDFKVATTFVRNCRAGKRGRFALPEVQTLFDEADGTIADQVGLLERLGFLERVVQEGNSGPEAVFRIPDLYTRCWSQR